MGNRTLEMTGPAEIHIRRKQLCIEKEEEKVSVALEDLATIVCSGAGLRLSTAAMTHIAKAGITMMMIDERYNPAGVLLPLESNVRHSLVLRRQIELDDTKKDRIWAQIIKRKIENQASALTILGLNGSSEVFGYAQGIERCQSSDVDIREAAAAKVYFGYLHPGLNRRVEEPMNSRLNYGYAVLRNAIIRSLVLSGFHPAIGLHHSNQFNSFNLADDIIEPWRPFVDILAFLNIDSNIFLNKAQRRALAGVLHNACRIDETKTSVILGIDVMVRSLKDAISVEDYNTIKIPAVIPPEKIEAITE